MTLKPCRMACLMIASAAVAVASCATTGSTWPRAEDLRVEPEPVPSADILTSRIAGEKYDNAVEAHGEAGWAKVGRLCRFFRDQGMKGLTCPPPPDPG